ncbi:MAG: hypothetical protein NTV52_12525 [Acidobacteria bacterium]|nr:hypothetical protein [Acidobacteriota bacterium]
MSPYRPLTPWSPGLLRSGALYDGDDHLLHVTSSRVQHEYQRFPYSEIRSLTLTHLPLWSTPRIVWLAVSALLFLLALVTGRFGFTALPLLSLLAILPSIIRGQRCRARLLTLAGEWTLPALSTKRAADQAVPQILARIQAAQADLPAIPSGLPVITPNAAPVVASHPANLWYALSATLIFTALSIVLTARFGGARDALLTLQLFLFPTTLLLAIALWSRARRYQIVPPVLVVVTILDVLLNLVYIALEFRGPTFSLELAQLTLQFQNWKNALLAAAIGWRIFAAALAAWIGHSAEDPA